MPHWQRRCSTITCWAWRGQGLPGEPGYPGAASSEAISWRTFIALKFDDRGLIPAIPGCGDRPGADDGLDER